MLRGHKRTFTGQKTAEMAHDQHQVALVVEGAMVVVNILGAWTVPAGCAAWIPARTRYAIDPLPRAVVHTLYLSSGKLPCSVLTISPLMRAIVDHVCASP